MGSCRYLHLGLSENRLPKTLLVHHRIPCYILDNLMAVVLCQSPLIIMNHYSPLMMMNHSHESLINHYSITHQSLITLIMNYS
jgi:hypothetical protein